MLTQSERHNCPFLAWNDVRISDCILWKILMHFLASLREIFFSICSQPYRMCVAWDHRVLSLSCQVLQRCSKNKLLVATIKFKDVSEKIMSPCHQKKIAFKWVGLWGGMFENTRSLIHALFYVNVCIHIIILLEYKSKKKIFKILHYNLTVSKIDMNENYNNFNKNHNNSFFTYLLKFL